MIIFAYGFSVLYKALRFTIISFNFLHINVLCYSKYISCITNVFMGNYFANLISILMPILLKTKNLTPGMQYFRGAVWKFHPAPINFNNVRAHSDPPTQVLNYASSSRANVKLLPYFITSLAGVRNNSCTFGIEARARAA